MVRGICYLWGSIPQQLFLAAVGLEIDRQENTEHLNLQFVTTHRYRRQNYLFLFYTTAFEIALCHS